MTLGRWPSGITNAQTISNAHTSPNPCVPNGDREDSLGLRAATPQVTDHPYQGALKGRKSHPTPH